MAYRNLKISSGKQRLVLYQSVEDSGKLEYPSKPSIPERTIVRSLSTASIAPAPTSSVQHRKPVASAKSVLPKSSVAPTPTSATRNQEARKTVASKEKPRLEKIKPSVGAIRKKKSSDKKATNSRRLIPIDMFKDEVVEVSTLKGSQVKPKKFVEFKKPEEKQPMGGDYNKKEPNKIVIITNANKDLVIRHLFEEKVAEFKKITFEIPEKSATKKCDEIREVPSVNDQQKPKPTEESAFKASSGAEVPELKIQPAEPMTDEGKSIDRAKVCCCSAEEALALKNRYKQMIREFRNRMQLEQIEPAPVQSSSSNKVSTNRKEDNILHKKESCSIHIAKKDPTPKLKIKARTLVPIDIFGGLSSELNVMCTIPKKSARDGKFLVKVLKDQGNDNRTVCADKMKQKSSKRTLDKN